MGITTRVRTIFFVPTSNASEALIRLPSSIVGQYEIKCEHSGQVVASQERPPHRANIWSSEEHERFLRGLELFPTGPWKEVAAIVGTKTTRQTMTHAQKYRQKIERRLTVRPRQTKKPRSSAAQVAKKASLAELRMPDVWQPMGGEGLLSPVDITSHPAMYSTEVAAYSPRNEYNLGIDSNNTGTPMEVADMEVDLLDSINFEKEFESLIASLKPLPTLTH